MCEIFVEECEEGQIEICRLMRNNNIKGGAEE
jgi:hypothetical protein